MEKLKKGIKKKLQLTVGPTDTARHYGSGLVEVFASPAMIALMEKAALEAVAPYLEEGQNTVGNEVNVKHVKPTPVGDVVTCEATLEEVDGKRLVFHVEASDSGGLIGKGTHTRFIIDTGRFMSGLKK